jgi:hypothetical protein
MDIPREFDEANAVYRRQLRAMYRPVPMPEPDPKTAALIDIAHDCGTLEAAQRRAKDALRQTGN